MKAKKIIFSYYIKQTITMVGDYVCGNCGKGFANKWNLERHKERVCNGVSGVVNPSIDKSKYLDELLTGFNKIVKEEIFKYTETKHYGSMEDLECKLCEELCNMLGKFDSKREIIKIAEDNQQIQKDKQEVAKEKNIMFMAEGPNIPVEYKKLLGVKEEKKKELYINEANLNRYRILEAYKGLDMSQYMNMELGKNDYCDRVGELNYDYVMELAKLDNNADSDVLGYILEYGFNNGNSKNMVFKGIKTIREMLMKGLDYRLSFEEYDMNNVKGLKDELKDIEDRLEALDTSYFNYMVRTVPKYDQKSHMWLKDANDIEYEEKKQEEERRKKELRKKHGNKKLDYDSD